MSSKNISSTLIGEGIIIPFSTPSGYWMQINDNIKRIIYKLSDNTEAIMALRSTIKIKTGKYLSFSDCLKELDYLQLCAHENKTNRELVYRIAYSSRKNCIYYDLDSYKGIALKISADGFKLIKTPSKTFLTSSTYRSQVKPAKDVPANKLPELLAPHFNFQDKEQVILLALYLVSAFLSPIIKCPLLIFVGDKGSSKSTSMRRIESIIDPKTNDLCGMANTLADLQVQLCNNLFISLDNISHLNQRTSDILAQAVTGGSISKRRLYTDADQVILNLHSLVAINGIHLIAKSSDLQDRALVFALKRVKPEEIISEHLLDERFKKALPKILSAIMNALSKVLADNIPVKNVKKTRMVDFFETAIKVGRTFGLKDNKTADILWKNHEALSHHSLQENLVAQCLFELMEDRNEYKASVTELLGELQCIAEKNNIKHTYLPGQPNVLSRKLNEIRSNLEEEGIYYNIKNIGAFREIHIEKKRLVCTNNGTKSI